TPAAWRRGWRWSDRSRDVFLLLLIGCGRCAGGVELRGFPGGGDSGRFPCLDRFAGGLNRRGSLAGRATVVRAAPARRVGGIVAGDAMPAGETVREIGRKSGGQQFLGRALHAAGPERDFDRRRGAEGFAVAHETLEPLAQARQPVL